MQDVKQNPLTHNQTNPKTRPTPKEQLKNQPKKCAVQNTHTHTRQNKKKKKSNIGERFGCLNQV
jgi:hypothetical protein